MREPLKAEDIDLINYDRILEIAKSVQPMQPIIPSSSWVISISTL